MAEFIQSDIQVVNAGDTVLIDNEKSLLRSASKIVLKHLKKSPLLCGHFDGKNGNVDFMYGISTVMEVIANYAGDEDFEEEFMRNMMESREE